MRVLVTGGAGFIGSHLVDRLLDEGHQVSAVDNLSTGFEGNLQGALRFGDAFDLVTMDIREPGVVSYAAKWHPEIIVHLAAQASVSYSTKQPLLDAEINVVGSLQLLDAARTAGVRKFLYAASGGSLYGAVNASELPISERSPRAPSSPYGVSKAAVIDYLRAFRGMCGLDYCALAMANVYGPRQRSSGEGGVVAIFAENVRTGRPSTIDGDGEQTRDFVYVADVVDAFVRATTRGSEQVLNIGAGKRISINELYRTLLSVAGRSVPVVHGPPRLADVRHNSLDPSLAMKTLGWEPRIDLRTGLAETYASVVPSDEADVDASERFVAADVRGTLLVADQPAASKAGITNLAAWAKRRRAREGRRVTS